MRQRTLSGKDTESATRDAWFSGPADGKGPDGNPMSPFSVAEIDIVEAYDIDMTIAHQNVHCWNTAHDMGLGHSTRTADLSADWHVFSCLIDDARIHFYIDGQEVWNTPALAEAKLPLYIMVSLALAGGWPIDKAYNASKLLVDYVRVYAPPNP
jgi:beta-glucanase (GH16 family)